MAATFLPSVFWHKFNLMGGQTLLRLAESSLAVVELFLAKLQDFSLEKKWSM